MRVKVYPRADGTSDIYVQKTRPREVKSILLSGVKPQDLQEAVGKAIAEARGPFGDEIPRLF